LFAAAFFPVSGYVGAIAMGRLLSMVVSMISQCFFCDPVLFTLLSYFVDHLHKHFAEGDESAQA
jgi:hypothetical protein